jgi:hypothetical protein
MRIKPYVILGLAMFCAGAGLAVIVTTADPATAEPRMLWLFWASLFLAVWGLVAVICSVAGSRLRAALPIGLVWAVSVVGLLGAARHGYRGVRLSAAVIGATILLTVALWIRSKRSNN